MTIRRSDFGSSDFATRRLKLRDQQQRKLERRLLLEQLEQRQLLTTGPQLIGIQPNEGELLSNNQTRQVAPRELVFQFDDLANLDPASIADSIQVTRSGFDGQFERASVLTDLGTSGQVVFQFAAVAPGEAGNGISLVFTKSNHGGSSLPTVTVSGRQINVDLNTNSGNETTASDLLTAMTNSAAASSLVTTSLELGNLLARVDQNVSVGAPLTLAGANHAKVSSSFNAGSNVQLSFTAAQTGLAGNGIQIAVTKVDRGGPATPRVTVSGRTINLELNSHLGNETTAQEVVTAVNGNATARALVTARLNFGSGLTKLGNRTLTFSPLRLAGANDVVIQPGHLELAENGREVIFRFADNLPDDRYRIDILGAGANPLLDENGLPFNGGRDQSVEFRLDLAPRVEAVVPQPITRTSTGALQQARNQIVVYFNHDHLQGDTLDPVKASDPSFYKLYLTKGTVRNTDDTLIPASVSFDATTETATLTFANDLQQLAGNTATGGTFRLRIGTDEAIPAVPVTLTPQNDPGSSFDTALDLAANWSPNADPSQSIVISSSIANANPYLLDFPGASDEPGHREIPSVQDHVPGGADDRPGITTIPYNFRLEYGFDSRNNVLLNSITENQKQRAREVFELYGNYLGVQFIETASQGMTIVTGDLRAINPTIPTGIGAPYSLSNAQGDLVIMELQDFNQPGDDIYGGDWFRAAFKEIGRALGYGPTTELPGLSLAVDTQNPGPTAEPVFPGDADVLHGQFMYRPESNDIDLYQFTLTQTGRISIETFAERQANPSLVDTVITLYRENANGTHELVARNDDYYSNDSFLELELGPGKYFVGVSASGNNQYNPTIEDSGIGGTTGDDPSTPNIDEGAYELRLNFRPNADDSLTDSTGVVFDGDADGVPGGVHNFWFRTQSAARTLIVDKSAPVGGNGSLAAPYSNLQTALTAAAAQPNSIVRIVGNGGADGDLTTEADNDAYEIGFNRLGNQLADGPRFEVPKDVTVMIDAGAVFKLRRAMVAVGSTAVNVDHSGASLQVLGTPRLLTANGQVARDSNGQVVEGSVFFTSIHDNAIGDDTNADVSHPAALPGDWGGIWYRNDIDSASKRFDWENEGIYLNVVNHADMRYGGGDVIVSGVTQPVAPIHMTDSRPTVSYNTITGSADAAMSANPDSFKETSFHTAEFQQRGAFTADYTRVGPDIQFNHLTDNSFNALFVRLRTPAGNDLETLTVPGRFDDTDVVHVIAENLLIEGVAGGPISQVATPPTQLVKLDPLTGGTLPLGTYNYRLTYVDAQGNESPASDPSRDITLTGGQTAVLLSQLPRIPSGSGFVERRLYRSQPDGSGPYNLIHKLNSTAATYLDNGTALGGVLVEDVTALNLQPRLDASLVVDPGTIVKFDGARIETRMGGQLVAEGHVGHEIVFTSLQDDRYGAGGSYDTSNQLANSVAERGDWGGLLIGALGELSLDHAVVSYAGGITKMDGSFAGVNAVELHQATARITNTTFEQNASGVGGQANANRFGRGSNSPGSIFVRGSQPIIVNNIFQHNDSSAININVNSLNSFLVDDVGRSTGNADIVEGYKDNVGPLIRLNRVNDNGGYDSDGTLMGVNGMVVRGGTLTTEGVWDDTDIVHVVLDQEISIPDFHTFGGLSLKSSADESLVVKLDGDAAGFTANGTPLDINDRIGGALHLIGQPRFPVVLTAIADDTVGAGLRPDGMPQTDTNNDGDFREMVDGGGIFCPPATGTALTVTGTTIDGDALRDAMLGDGIIPVGNATYIGGATSSGFFQNGNAIGMACGIVLSTGDADTASGPNLSDSSSAVSSGLPDAQLDALYTTNTQDTTSLEFQFISQGGNLFFNYVFASEEYNEFANSTFNDVFAFFLDGVNIALIPGTTTPVTINNINGGNPLGTNPMNPQLYNNNDPGDAGGFLAEFGYDGFTDVLTATALNLSPGVHTIRLVVSDVTDTAFDSAVFLQMGSFSDEPPAAPPAPGAWDGVTLDTYSHDRNIATVAEAESRSGQVPGANANPLTAQYIGELAPNEKGGDESRRLGFTVHGLLSQPGDVDTYSFKAAAGTEVWLDIDRTGMGLDSVVELVTADGLIQALSNDSLAEEQAGEVAFASSGIDANPLRKQAVDFAATNASGLVKDFYSTNQRDAGLRVVLPGTPGQVGTYHVRVRSSNLGPNDTADKLWNDSFITSGRTSGSYQLQVRLRELDEIAGSSIEYSDIRFANTGITVAGNPLHSPLQGEVAEDDSTNDISADAQYIGNLLQTDRAVISLAGQLQAAPGTTLPDNVDWYRVDLNYDALESIPGVTTASQYFATMFDIDYADGLARANTSLHIYDSSGNLILRATDSNVSEDRPGPLQGTGLTDLSRGSVGGLDPLVGAVQLPVGTYLVAVSNGTQVPAELEQYLVANPVNPLFRLEPINSVRRIVDEHIEPLTPETRPTGAPPVVDNFIDLNVNAVPFQLGDVTLFVSLDSTPLANGSQLFTVDPVTGNIETFVGQFGTDVGDIGMRPTGELFAFNTDIDDLARTDTTAGSYLRINTGTATTTTVGAYGLQTFHRDTVAPFAPIPSDDGMHFEAIAYTFDAAGNPLGLAVGSRPPTSNTVNRPGLDYLQNALYTFDPATGNIISTIPVRTGANLLLGAGTNLASTGQIQSDVGTTSGGNTAIVGATATTINPLSGQTIRQLVDGIGFRIQDSTTSLFYDFELDSGPEIRVTQDPDLGITVRDGDVFTLDTTPYEIDTGTVIVVEALNGSGLRDGETITIANNQSPTVFRTFEFNNGIGGTGSNIEVRFNSSSTQAQIVQSLVTAINNANFGVTAVVPGNSNRISLIGESELTGIAERPTGIGIEGSPGSFSASLLVRAEETYTAEELAQAIADAVNARNVGGVTAGVVGDRVNFSGALFGQFSALSTRGAIFDWAVDGGSTPGTLPIPFLADDTAEEVATRIANAINGARVATFSAVANGKVVDLTGATVLSANPPLLPGGAGPGGTITGMAFLGSRLFAVSDRGGLYEVSNFTTPDGAITRYVSESANDLLGISFQGLVAGPRNAEGGAYQDMLVAVDDAGVLYAFDEFGQLQPVFADGATQAFTGLGVFGEVNGLAFSNLDYNLWHSTTFEPANDGAGGTITAGHGVEAAFDGSRIGRDPLIPNESLWFGFESLASNNVPNLSPLEQPTNLSGTYDFPGGAHGAIETEPFSLTGYSPADQPVLYLNYFLESENTNWTLTNPMRDAARIYVGDDSGEWRLLATNNSTRLASTGELVEGLDSPFDVQELFDVPAAGAQNWRQIRVPLDAVAGLDNLRLRIEFSTAGSMNVGDPDTTGDELRAIPGNELRDGQTFEIDGDTIFEIESGYTLVVPSGAAIIDGDTFTIRNGAQGAPDVIFEFDNGNGPNGSGIVVPYTADQTASQIALTIQQLIVANQSAPTVITGVDIGREDNDRLATALNVGITGESVRVTATGSIGDNPSLTGADRGLDVDLIRMDLGLNGRVQIDVDAQQRNSPLDAALRVFDANGIELAFNDNFNGLDPFIEFVAPAPGTYYVGVSNSTNIAYDATEDASGIAPATGGIGPYDLTITVMESVAAHRDGNRLSLEGINDILIDPISPLIVDGQVGSGSPNTVFVHGGMSDNEVATAIRYALAARYAQNHVDAVRGYEHVVRVIGHSVSDSGPFGLTNTLDGDLFGEFTSATRSLRGQNNAFRGFFIDDIIIGFAERGEMATGAVQNTSFVTDPLADPFDIQVGPYQLEIRGATEYGQPLPLDPLTNAPRIQLDRSFDTNDRLTQQHTIIAPAASQLTDGQTFTLGDGVNEVVFEYEDVLVENGVTPGRVRIDFNTAALDPITGAHAPEPAWVIAARLRDAINSPQVQSLLDITAALSDGTQRDSQSATFQSNDIRINLFGNAIITTNSTTLSADLINTEANDVLAGAVVSGIVGGNSDRFRASGFIGDNTNLAEASNDVDLIQVSLVGGERITVDIDTPSGSSLDSFLRIFDEFGFPLTQFVSDDDSAPGEVVSLDSFLTFTAPTSGIYYIGVSSFDNEDYDPFVEGNANSVGSSTGAYSIEILRPDLIGSVGIQVHDAYGDANHFRDQGQLIINANRISNSGEFAIEVGPGARQTINNQPVDGAPNPGAVRNTRELNTQRLVPGVTISNNLLTNNVSGGIAMRGDVTDNLAPVPFGRIINNTIVGGTVRAAQNASSELVGDTIYLRGSASFADTVVDYNPLFGNGPEPDTLFADSLQALGAPDYVVDPVTLVATGAVSLGHGGQLTVEFTDNALTGSGDAAPDLFIYEVDDENESVFVEISKDGTAFFAVGKASGANGAIDLDAFGFGPNDLFRFVRLTDDASQGSSTGLTVGADIDAIGAISSYVSPTFNAGGQGILVADNASPTILNNLLINNETGIEIDATSSAAGAVVGGTIYQHNTTDANTSIGLGDFPLVLGDAERLFVDPVAGNYYLADGARAIDSAIDSMQDRPALVSVKTPLGLPATPVLAPNTDLTGQLRVDDPRVETPSGVGERVFKDRGALDRSDFVGPTGQLTTPRDNDGAGQDRNPNMNVVELSSQVLNNFTIQLIDGIGPVDPNDGIGAADNTVTRNSVVLYRGTNEDNLQPLVEGVDYRFHYDSTNNSIVLTPLSGIWQSDQLYRVELAGEQRFVLVAPSGTQVRDGSTFSVADQSGETVTFEIERGYTLTLPTATSVTDQETFTIDDGTKVVTFEFDSDSSYDTNNRQVVFDPLNPLSSATTALINAIVSANLGLTPTDLGSGVIHLGGTRLHNVDVTGSSLTLSGSPGVSQLPFGIQIPSVAGLPSGLQDQQTFSITNGALTVVFELDTNGSVSSGHRQVRFFTTSTVDGVANAIVNAIAGAGLALSPVNLGGGLVGLGGNAGILLDTGTTGLTQTGTAGVDASVAVPITGDVSNANVVAQQMAAAINSASVLLSGVSALAVGDQVLLDGASAVSGSSAISVPSIKDLAGNPLKSNQPDGSTTFDIFLGSGLDFGDAPDGPYDSKLANNGPRHQIVDGFFLGSGVTVDVDGPGPDQADSDRQDDGIVFMSNFVRGYNSQFTVSVAGGPGVVDAWIDFNQDGDFDDSGEQILSGVTLAEGTHQLELRNRNPLASDIQDRGEVPGSAELGTTYARFRLSSNGVSGPNGAAADGEVEDYQIDIFANDYQNRSNALDVNADGFVSPIDALLVINFLNASSAGQLPQNRPTPGPPFWDVNGDGQISPIDVGQVITYLNDVNNGSGEGDATLLAEGESTVSTLQAADLSNGLATLAMPQEIIAGMTQRWEATNSVAVTGSSTSQQDESDETPASVGIASNGNQANSAALDPTALALADLDDVLSEIAEDIEGSQVNRDAHDDFFANIHF